MNIIKKQLAVAALMAYFGLLIAFIYGIIFVESQWIPRLSIGFIVWVWVLMGLLEFKSGIVRDLFSNDR